MAKNKITISADSGPRVVYENENFLGVYKPSGLIVHPIRTLRGKRDAEKESSLTDWLVKNYPEVKKVGDDPDTRPGIVHRLDKETSGIILVPRNQKYFEYFKNLFKTRQIKKSYVALVMGEPKEKEGVIDKPIGIKTGSVKRSIHSEKMKKNAVTRYEVKKTYGSGENRVSLLEVFPETGRTHQIRVHLASIGHPIIGDKLYGGKKQRKAAGRLMLHAKSIEFSLPAGAGGPAGGRIKLETEPDASFGPEIRSSKIAGI